MAWFIDEAPKQDNIYNRETYQVSSNTKDPVIYL